MKASPDNVSKNIDPWLMGFALLGIVIFSLLLWDESWFRGSKSKIFQKKIGTVNKLKLDVRRRIQDDFIWMPLEDLESVYFGDSIFTGTNSTAAIAFETGVLLWVDPNSLIVLDQMKDAIKLNLKFGQLRGKLASQESSSLKININNQDLDLSGKSVEFSLEKGKTKETQLKVTEGIASVTDKKAQHKIKMAKSEKVTLGREVASIAQVIPVKEELVFVRQEQWAHSKNIWMSEKGPLSFTWQTEGPVDRFELWVSQTKEGTDTLLKESLKVNGFEWTPPFEEGTLFWKVKAFGSEGEGIESDLIQWNIGMLYAPEWIGLMNPHYLFQPQSSQIQWKSHLSQQLFRLEWSLDAEFSSVERAETKESSWTLPSWQPGRYFVRVRSESLGRPASLWSIPLIIIVTDKDPEGLVSPKWGHGEVETLEKVEAPQVQWAPQEKTSQYVVEVSKEPGFTKVETSVVVHKVSWVGSPQLQGDYFLRVSPLSSSGRRGPPSEILKWHARTTGPKVEGSKAVRSVVIKRNERDELLPFPETRLGWVYSGAMKASEFLVEQSLRPDFLEKTETRFKEPHILVKDLKPGTYYYRMRAVSSEGNFSMASSPLRLEVTDEKSDGLVPPVIAKKELADKSEGDRKPRAHLQWESIGGAAQYRVEMSEDPEFSKIIFKKEVTSNHIEFEKERPGTSYIRVAAISKNSRLGPWGEIVPWTFTPGPPVLLTLERIKVTVPAADSEVPPTLAPLKWLTLSSFRSFFLEVAQGEDFNKPFLRQAIKNKHEYQVKLTKPGMYRARVKVINDEGADVTSYSQTMAFEFFVHRPLVAPVLLTPKDKVSYILSKMKNPQIWLEWTGDKMANFFEIEFAKDRKFTTIMHTLKTKESRMLLDHKVIRGKIFWRVRSKNIENALESPWSTVWALAVVDIENED